ncbi:MAG TPA: hypothetical protein VIN36_01750 [Thiobacillus sp.]
MEPDKALRLLKGIIEECMGPSGAVDGEKFFSLREVDAKREEAVLVLQGVAGLPEGFCQKIQADPNFTANSRRIRAETLVSYLKTAIKFIDAGGITKPKKQILAPPNFSKLTSTMPGLEAVIEDRWREAQRCQHVEAHTAAVILMGSVLEGLLLCKATLDPSRAYQSAKAPKNKEGKAVAIQDWSLSVLVEVAADLGWLKTDRAKFGHALRESRNAVHPWQAVAMKANFDESTCRTSWEVLMASVNDLLK